MGAQGGQTDPDRIHKGTEGKQYGPSGDQKATIANQTGTQIDHMRPKGRQPEPQRIHNGDQGKQKGPSGNPRATIAFFEHLFKQRSEVSILKCESCIITKIILQNSLKANFKRIGFENMNHA